MMQYDFSFPLYRNMNMVQDNHYKIKFRSLPDITIELKYSVNKIGFYFKNM